MTQTKNYQFGPYKMRCYFKPAGNGFEVGMVAGGRTHFVGNFVHAAEARKWWGMMNRTLTTFGKKYWMNDETPFAWYCNFLASHMYKTYYTFVDKMLSKHNRNYNREFTQKLRKFKHFTSQEDVTRYPVRKAA